MRAGILHKSGRCSVWHLVSPDGQQDQIIIKQLRKHIQIDSIDISNDFGRRSHSLLVDSDQLSSQKTLIVVSTRTQETGRQEKSIHSQWKLLVDAGARTTTSRPGKDRLSAANCSRTPLSVRCLAVQHAGVSRRHSVAAAHYYNNYFQPASTLPTGPGPIMTDKTGSVQYRAPVSDALDT